jgi:hypothetical protein
VGKTTMVEQVVEELACPVRFVSADEPQLRGRDWLVSPIKALGQQKQPEALRQTALTPIN